MRKNAKRWFGLYRCQNHFWAIEIAEFNVEDAKGGWPNQSVPIQMRQLSGQIDATPIDLGLMTDGEQNLAYAAVDLNFEDD